MIIKSMSRKEPSFRQLIDYMSDIDKSDEQYNVYQNVFARKAEDLEAEFQQNARLIPKRKNGVYLYHEILSITAAQKLDRKQQKAILRDVAYEYAQRRAKQNLVFGALHDDHDEHLHYHLLISANAAGESKKTRLSKAEFDRFKKSMEKLVLERYPQLEQEVVINREAGEKLSNRGAERRRRTGATPERDRVKQKLHDIFASAPDKQSLFEALTDAGMEFYARGKTLGVKDLATDRNHRLKTLGLLEAFNNLSDRIELAEAASQSGNEPSDDESTDKTDSDSAAETSNDSQEEPDTTGETETKSESTIHSKQEQPESSATDDAAETARAKRREEMETIRKQRAERDGGHQDRRKDKPE